MTPRTGRPPAELPRKTNVQFRVTDPEQALLAEAAGDPKAVNAWARDRVLAAARREVAKRRRAG
jgi:hypothetical protein